MLQRKNCATLAEIMSKMNWQKHTVRPTVAQQCHSLSGSQQPQFPRPVGERQSQPFQIGMPSADLSLDRGDLTATTLDSRSLLLSFA
jgi:hypothetical protein